VIDLLLATNLLRESELLPTHHTISLEGRETCDFSSGHKCVDLVTTLIGVNGFNVDESLHRLLVIDDPISTHGFSG
jgi:hypothetical protein